MTNAPAGHCAACRGEIPALTTDELPPFLRQLADGWRVVNGHHLEKDYSFPDFRSALAFANRVGEIAEADGHHPEIHVAWGRVRLAVWTYKADGLTEIDFVLAAKADRSHAAA